jgi:hypothetical protein
VAIEFSAPDSRPIRPFRERSLDKGERKSSHLRIVRSEIISPKEQEIINLERSAFDPAEPVEQINIVSWNVLNKSTPEQIAHTLTRIERDHGLTQVICAQEVPADPNTLGTKKSGEKAWEIADKLGMSYVHFTPQTWLKHNRMENDKSKKDQEWLSGPAIFSRYPFVPGSTKIHKLGEGKGGPDFYKYRYGFALLLTADIQVPVIDPLTGEIALVNRKIGTYHLSTSTEMPWNRKKEVDNLSSLLKDCDLAFGDANARPGSRYAKTIFEAIPRVDGSDEHTYADKFFGVEVRRKLDFGGAKDSNKVISSERISYKGRSDHFPMRYEVKM